MGADSPVRATTEAEAIQLNSCMAFVVFIIALLRFWVARTD
jgi:hypothetical protein